MSLIGDNNMEFNTSTLGYKLISGKLKNNRNHSEQLNKYLAGLIDADGSFFLYFLKGRSGETYTPYCFFSLSLSESSDKDFILLKALRDFYNLGKVTVQLRDGVRVGHWHLASRETRILSNKILKHLRLKAKHLDNLLWVQEELRGVKLSEENVEELKDFSKCSRINSTWLKEPKHPSWTWLAGFLDGDGHYRCRVNRKVFVKRDGQFRNHNQLVISATSCDSDRSILDFISNHIGGSVKYSSGYPTWTMGLGRSSEKRSLPFLKQMRKYSCLRLKYSIIEDMIKFHEDKSQRLSESGAKA